MGKQNRNNLGRSLQKSKENRIKVLRQLKINNSKTDDWILKQHITDEIISNENYKPKSIIQQDHIEEMFDRRAINETPIEYSESIPTVRILNNKEQKNTLFDSQIMARLNNSIEQLPIRPTWLDKTLSTANLDMIEKEEFNKWRKKIHLFQNNENVSFTPYEKSLNVWRQLWHVIEQSDLICQIVDARDPLLFYCVTIKMILNYYFPNKKMLLLLNKADLLTNNQMCIWDDYFKCMGVDVVFWSAITTTNSCEANSHTTTSNNNQPSDIVDRLIEKNDNQIIVENTNQHIFDHNHKSSMCTDNIEYVSKGSSSECGLISHQTTSTFSKDEKVTNSLIDYQISNIDDTTINRIFTRIQLINLFEKYAKDCDSNIYAIGMIGFPNVGKSSTLNQIMQMKKVAVSATPGKTKHFQTFMLKENIKLIDCPGLVFPTIVNSLSHMVLGGVLPIDHIRDFTPAIDLMVSLIPQYIFEYIYNIVIPITSERIHKDYCNGEELLSSFSVTRGLLTSSGTANLNEAAKIIIKDYIKGKIVYVQQPPSSPYNIDSISFNNYDEIKRLLTIKCDNMNIHRTQMRSKIIKMSNMIDETTIEEQLQKKMYTQIYPTTTTLNDHHQMMINIDVTNKHWRKQFKKKKGKIRRKYKGLDGTPYD